MVCICLSKCLKSTYSFISLNDILIGYRECIIIEMLFSELQWHEWIFYRPSIILMYSVPLSLIKFSSKWGHKFIIHKSFIHYIRQQKKSKSLNVLSWLLSVIKPRWKRNNLFRQMHSHPTLNPFNMQVICCLLYLQLLHTHCTQHTEPYT